MAMRSIAILASAAAAAVGCSLPSGESERQEAAKQEANEQSRPGAEGKAEEGRLSIRAPGVDIAINVPDPMRSRARANADNEVLPPGAQISGLHFQGDGGNREAGRDSVELRFIVRQPTEQVAAWYRDPARGAHFTIREARREGNALVLTGTHHEGSPISVRLEPREGGTDGRLVLVDRD